VSAFPTAVLKMALVKEDPEEQSDVDQQNPEHLHIKEEEEELCTSLEGEQLHLEQETDAVRFPFTAVSIKSEDDAEKPVLSQLHHQQIEDRDVPTSSSDDQMTAGTECGKQFFQKWSLQTHLRVMGHSAISSSDCLVNKCDGVKQPIDSRRKAQTELKLFSCDDCGKRFGTKSNLNSHMNVHTGQKRFACELCGQRFSHKTSLNRHLRVHTGQKPFACGHCGQRFSRKTTLNTHRRVHTGQKPFRYSEVSCHHYSHVFGPR
uniref:C2H2-type domain-containing protein n=1 Tax=Nothobranchius furzeri TaxID=105023 RepID=A0A8C6LNU2_NOTFU